jgi:hypothetical protein
VPNAGPGLQPGRRRLGLGSSLERRGLTLGARRNTSASEGNGRLARVSRLDLGPQAAFSAFLDPRRTTGDKRRPVGFPYRHHACHRGDPVISASQALTLYRLPGGLVPGVILPTFVAACRRAGLAGRPPGPPGPIPPARQGWHPAAFVGGPPGRGRRVLLDGLSYRRPAIARRGIPHGSGLGRWRVERTIAWLHQYRRLRIRWERRVDIHQAFLKLACCLICWRCLQRSFS